MGTATARSGGGASVFSVLDRDRIVAAPGFNRWLVPPAALAIHLCIGMAYGFSVFWLPLSRAIGGSKPLACPAGSGILNALFTTSCDWLVADLNWIFTLFIVVLGIAAAVWGGWLERAGPRKAGVLAAFCWSGGLLLGAIGIVSHQLWILWLGTGVLGGIGLGLGYISPVSTLIKWFPDRRGMATGMAIMGFGGGAMIGAPLAQMLMAHFAAGGSGGVWQTFVVMGVIYLVFMMGGAFGYRVPAAAWQPAGWTPPEPKVKAMITHGQVHLRDAHKTVAFWAIWVVLCMNVSAGIGVISMASPMLQEIFGGSLVGHPDVSFTALTGEQRAAVAAIAAGFAGLLSLFNIVGRFFWASLSDHIGRKATYFVFFLLGIAMYGLAPWAAHAGSKVLFVAFFCVILSMYGGGFATVPAYLADMFGTHFVGAIHGRLLTAWSTAGLIGPVLVSYMREGAISAGVPRSSVYDVTLYLLAGLLVIGLIANVMVRPVARKWFMSDAAVAALQVKGGATDMAGASDAGRVSLTSVLAWATVGIPILWGVWITLDKVAALFL
ncbi:MAG TPA: OFA family MFS transporter [Rhodopila sp.]|jgi:MFS family permease|nr:OFA family MFS transporter [Rhodopila sp.]